MRRKDRLPLWHNPLFRRGLLGSHVRWKWWRRPLIGVPLLWAGVLVLLGYFIRRQPHEVDDTIVFILMITAGISTLAVFHAVSRVLQPLWARQQMTDLMLTPLSGAEKTWGLLAPALFHWVLWLVLIIPTAVVAHLFDTQEDFGEIEEGRYFALVYVAAQTLWVAGITFHSLLRHRSANMAQLEAALWVFLLIPALTGALVVTVEEFGFWLGIMTKTIAGSTLLVICARGFDGRIQRLMDH